MADQNLEGKPPVKEGEPKGVRFPEDELADIIGKQDGEASKGQDDTKDTGGGEEDASRKAEDASVEKLQGFMVKKGIKDIGGLVELAESLERSNTSLSQDVMRLKAGTTFSSPAEAGGAHRGKVEDDEDIVLPANPIELVTNPEKLKEFVKMLDTRAERRAVRAQQAAQVQGAMAEVAKKRDADPEKFDRLKPTMIELAGRNPNANLDQLYEMAEKAKDSEEAVLMEKFKKSLGLDGADTAKLRAALGRLRTAPISGGSGTQVTIKGDAQKEKEDLLEAIKNSDKF